MRVEPMLCKIGDKPFDSKDWLFEPKLDGIRIIAEKIGSKVNLYSRYFKLKNLQFSPIVQVLAKFKEDFILDGEICALDKKGIPRFQLIQDLTNLQDISEIERLTREKNIVYYVFDLLEVDHKDIRNTPLIERKEILKREIPDSRFIRKVLWQENDGKKLFRISLTKGLEGIIAKRKDSSYVSDFSANWLKIKGVSEQEAVIGGFTEGSGSRKGTFGALLLGLYENNKLQYVGSVGTGFDEKSLTTLLGKLRKIVSSNSYFTPPPHLRQGYGGQAHFIEKIFWVKPKLVAQIKFAEWTQDLKMRQPVFLGLRDDKEPNECVFEK